MDKPEPIRNRVTEMLGVDYPVVQAPMGWIARSQLASAVSNAGGLGIIETSSGELDVIKAEIAAMRTLTEKPFGVNIAQAFVRDPAIADFVVEQGVRFVTTSAGDPTKYTSKLKAAGLTVFHVVPTLAAAALISRALCSADASGSYSTRAASASGIEHDGTTRTSFLVNSPTWLATGMMFLLFGNRTIWFAFMRSTASSNSAVEGLSD